MDRRTFIATAGAATAVACANATTAIARTFSPSLRGRGLVLACPAPESAAGLFDEACTLARAVERTMDRRVKIDVVPGPTASIDAITRGGADLFYGPEHANIAHVPALAFMAGPPGHLGMDARGLRAFMEQTGGKLWRACLDPFGIVPLYAGHGGESPLMWSRTRISSLTGLRIATSGLNAQVVAGLGGVPQSLKPNEIVPALASAHVDAAEIATLTDALAFGLPKVATFAARGALSEHAGALSLAIHERIWRGWTSRDQAAVLASVREHAQMRETRAAQTNATMREAISSAHGTVFYAAEGEHHMRRISEAVVAELAAQNAQTRQINDAYMIARRLSG